MNASRETLIEVFGIDRVENDSQALDEFKTKHPDEYRQRVWEHYDNKKNENVHICRECKGKCCRYAPCHFAPDDFESMNYRALKKIMKEKEYISVIKFSKRSIERSLDYTVGSILKHFYILRIRTSGTNIAAEAAKIEDDDVCMMLGDNGCNLPYELRPKGARMLIPRWENGCEQLYNMDDCVHDWIPHQKTLEKLYKYFERRKKIKDFFKRVHL